jgi:protein-tyrosine phosphatase
VGTNVTKSDPPSFLIPMDGLHNLRAVQGYAAADGRRLRPGLLYRSGAWERMTAKDRKWFAENVRTVLDLRHPDEAASAAAASLGAPPATLIPHSIFPPELSMAEFIAELNAQRGPGISSGRYLEYLRAGAAARFAQAVAMLAEADRYPVLVNCTAGKDRTGLLIAMVMELLGIDDETIGAEYERSNAGIDGLIAYLGQIGRQPEGTLEAMRSRMATPADRILGFLAGVRGEFGSVRELLAPHGVAEPTVAALGDILLE